MNEKTSNRNVKEVWRWSDWGEEVADAVTVRGPDEGVVCVAHERQIPEEWPKSVCDAVRREVLANRELAENEVRSGDGAVYSLSWLDGKPHWVREHKPECDWYLMANDWFDRTESQQWQPVEGAPGWEVRASERKRQNGDWTSVRVRNDALKADGSPNDEGWFFYDSEAAKRRVYKIRHHKVFLPEPVILACCKLLGVEREVALGENETVAYSGKRGTMAIYAGGVVVTWETGYKSYYSAEDLYKACRDSSKRQNEWERRRKFYEANKPPELAENEVRCEQSVIQLRWHNGAAEVRYRGEEAWSAWAPSTGDYAWKNEANAWFRANCPIDRFVTEDGRVLEFRMRDDGEAEAISGDFKRDQTAAEQTQDSENWSDPHRALLRYRDAERAKWTFGVSDSGVVVRRNGCSGYGGYYPDEGISPQLKRQPTWVQKRAQALWEEKRPQWEVRLSPIAESTVTVHRNGVYAGQLDREGQKLIYGEQWPPHILAEARAKFRENYILKPNEIWFQGMPVEMVFVDVGPPAVSHVFVAGYLWWREGIDKEKFGDALTFTDEAERLEAWERMRAFYYDQHPGKCLTRYGEPCTFKLDSDGVGSALVDATSSTWLRTSVTPSPGESPSMRKNREKLRRWTEAQLAKRPVKFEGKVEKFTADNDLKRVERMGQVVGFDTGPNKYVELVFDDGTELRLRGEKLNLPQFGDERRLRVTLEPIESEGA